METRAGRGTTLRWILCVTLPTEVVLLGFIFFLVCVLLLRLVPSLSPPLFSCGPLCPTPPSLSSSSLFLSDSPTDRFHSGNSAANVKWKWILVTSVTGNSEDGRWFAPATFAAMFVSWSDRAADSCCSYPSPFPDGFFLFSFYFSLAFFFCSPFKHSDCSSLFHLFINTETIYGCLFSASQDAFRIYLKFSTPSPMDLLEGHKKIVPKCLIKAGLICPGASDSCW